MQLAQTKRKDADADQSVKTHGRSGGAELNGGWMSFALGGPVQAKLRQAAPNDPPGNGILVQRKCDSCELEDKLQEGPLQTKLIVGAPGDHAEREADRVADQLVGGSGSVASPTARPSGTAQPKCAACDEEKVQAKSEGAGPGVSSGSLGGLGNGQALPKAVAQNFGPRLGADFSGVRVHTDAGAAGMAEGLGARAFTAGRDIVFNRGEYTPDSSSGKHLLAHELAHVVQQRRSGPAVQREGKGGGPQDPDFLGPDFIKQKADVEKLGLDKQVVKVRIKDVPYLLWSPHDEGGKIALTGLVESSEAYVIRKSTYYTQVWAKQAGKNADTFYSGWVNPQLLGPPPAAAAAKGPAPTSTPADVETEQQKDPDKAMAEAASSQFMDDSWTEIGELGIVYKQGELTDGGGVNLRKSPGGTIIRWLPQNTKVYILKEKQGSTNAYAVTVIAGGGSAGEFGYVARTHVWRHLPDPDSNVYQVKSGDSPIEIAKAFYAGLGFNVWGKDARYVVNALVWVNQQSQHNGAGGSGIRKEAVSNDWYTSKSTADVYIWLPGAAFMNAIYDKVAQSGGGTGSLTADMWQTLKKVGEYVAYGLAFVGGLLHGFLKSIWDAIAGLVTTVADVLVSIFTGNVLSDAKELWDAVSGITWDQIKEAVGNWAEGWEKKLNSSSPWTAGHAHGYLTGYIMAEAAQLLLTGGTLAAAKGALWGSRLGKALKATRAFVAFEKGIAATGKAGHLAREAIEVAATAIGKTKVFTVLAEARRWVGKALALSAETIADLVDVDAINRLRELTAEQLAKLKKFAEPVKRIILGCHSPCKVDIAVIKKYLDDPARAAAKGKAVKGAQDILDALPAGMDKTMIKAKLAQHPALVTAIEKAGLTPDDLAVMAQFLTPGDLSSAAQSYRTFVRTMTQLVPAKIGPDVKLLNEIAEAVIAMEPRWGSAFKGPMFESFAKLHLGRFRNLSFGRATWDKLKHTMLKKSRSSDGFIDSVGGLWDFKHTVAKVDIEQADDYFKILTQGLTSVDGQKARSVNYLFATLEGAEANADLAKKGFGVFYVTPPDVVSKLK